MSHIHVENIILSKYCLDTKIEIQQQRPLQEGIGGKGNFSALG
jgi:hypothetical protein